MAEDPSIVFSVKELIGRLDGKLDMMMNVLTNKADRADVASLERRVGTVEEKITEIRQRDVAAASATEAEEKVKKRYEDNHRWKIGALTTVGLLLAAIATIVVMVLQSKGH